MRALRPDPVRPGIFPGLLLLLFSVLCFSSLLLVLLLLLRVAVVVLRGLGLRAFGLGLGLLGHDVLELGPEGLDGGELVSDLLGVGRFLFTSQFFPTRRVEKAIEGDPPL